MLYYGSRYHITSKEVIAQSVIEVQEGNNLSGSVISQWLHNHADKQAPERQPHLKEFSFLWTETGVSLVSK